MKAERKKLMVVFIWSDKVEKNKKKKKPVPCS